LPALPKPVHRKNNLPLRCYSPSPRLFAPPLPLVVIGEFFSRARPQPLSAPTLPILRSPLPLPLSCRLNGLESPSNNARVRLTHSLPDAFLAVQIRSKSSGFVRVFTCFNLYNWFVQMTLSVRFRQFFCAGWVFRFFRFGKYNQVGLYLVPPIGPARPPLLPCE